MDIIAAARGEMTRLGLAPESAAKIAKNVLETGNIYGRELDVPAREGEVLLYLGCQYLGRPNLARNWIRILDALGLPPKIVPETCCGFPLKALGRRYELESQRERFRELVAGRDMITLCPTCACFIEEEYGIAARHVLEVIAELDFPKGENLKVTYHDPCDLSRVRGVIEEPRELLRKIGAELVEMPRSGIHSACCGGGGGMLVSSDELAGDIAKGRVREAVATGADILVTACPTCEKTLKDASRALKKSGNNWIRVRELGALLKNLHRRR